MMTVLHTWRDDAPKALPVKDVNKIRITNENNNKKHIERKRDRKREGKKTHGMRHACGVVCVLLVTLLQEWNS